MALQFIITNAGRAAIAQVGGAIGPVTLTKIAIGSAGYTPTASRTALQTEIKRLDPSGSSVPVPGTIHLTAQDDSADSYSVKEIGLYTNNNVLFAIYSQTGVILTKGSTASALFAMDFVLTNVPAGTVVVGDAGFSYAQANETRLGVLAIATTTEAQAGIIDTKIITPLKLAQVTATESRRGIIALASTAEAQSLVPDATKALSVARLVDRTATEARVGVVELATNAETQTGTDTARAVTPAGLASAAALLVPTGAVVPFATATPPNGWLPCDGRVVSRTTYSLLFYCIGTTFGAGDGNTTFALPDLRGYFVRGSGRNADNTESGTFGAKQADATGPHTHSGTTLKQNADHTHSTIGNATFPDAGVPRTSGIPAASPGNHTVGRELANKTSGFQSADHGHDFSTNGQTPAGTTETRPKNIALLYCIKF